jgi:multidrug transporter EmrE-like cation transporter
MNKLAAYSLVVVTIVLTVYGQFAIKWQVLRSPAVPAELLPRALYVLKLMATPLVLSAFAAAVLASVSWMLAMSRLPLSHAYPMTALTFVLVVMGSNVMFGEPLNAYKIAGLLLVVAGIIVGSQG